MKIKYKIAVLFSIICSLFIGLTGLFLYIFFSNNIEKQFRERLLERAIIAAEVLLEKDEVSANKYQVIKSRYLQTLPQEEVFYLPVLNGQLNFSTVPDEILNKAALENALKNNYDFYSVGDLQVCSLFYEDNEGDYIILLAAKNEEGAAQLADLQNILLAIVLGAFFLIAIVSLLFANHILKPINSMILKVEEIKGNNLQLRLYEGSGKDEISRLAKTFNSMLARLEASFYTQEKFIQNTSHELRTPLTIILGEAEYALKSQSLKAEEKVAFEKIYKEADHLKALLNSLLHLSEIKNNHPGSGFEIVRIDEIIQQVVIKMNQINPESKINLEYRDIDSLTANSFEISGNQLWLEIAVTNLLNNALKYSGNKPVKISLFHKEQQVEIIIEDQGIGIPEKDLEKIFKPFYRANNAQPLQGHGVGLALTYNIVKIHKGDVIIDSSNKGVTVSIFLPTTQGF